jgi:nucleoid-associated protein YgaU
VGLAFIILFAIILSEKGTTHRENKVPVFSVADAGKSIAPPSGSEHPLGNAGHLAVESTLPSIIPSAQPTALTSAVPTFESVTPTDKTETAIVTGPPAPVQNDEDTTTVLPESLVQGLNLPPIEVKTTEQVESAVEKPKTQEPLVAAATDQPKASTPDTLIASNIPDTAKPTPAPINTRTETSKIGDAITIKTVHTVKPGESLGKIAAQYYGRSTPKRIDAIFKSNRDVLKAPQSVKASQKLKIPDLGEHSAAFEDASDFLLAKSTTPKTTAKPAANTTSVRIPVALEEQAKPQTKPATTSARLASSTTTPRTEKPSATAFQWYQVRRADTLSRIAKRELGSEKRLNDILRLNKDVISNKNTLKPGMKIRLPLRTSGAIEQEMAVTTINGDNAEP